MGGIWGASGGPAEVSLARGCFTGVSVPSTLAHAHFTPVAAAVHSPVSPQRTRRCSRAHSSRP